MAGPDSKVSLELDQPLHAVRPKSVTHIKFKILSASIRAAVSSPVILDDPVPGLHQGRKDVFPHLGAAETMVEKNQGFSFPVAFVVNLQVVDRDVGHVNLVEYRHKVTKAQSRKAAVFLVSLCLCAFVPLSLI
jgi:hypothetical protein